MSMSYRKKIGIWLICSLVVFVVGYFIFYLDIQNICCYRWADKIGQPIGIGGLSLSLIFLILLFTKEAVFNTWKKFGIWYVPLTALLIFIAPSSSGGSFGYSMGFDREGVTMFLSALFLIISLFIIGIKTAKLKKISTSNIVKVILLILAVWVLLSYLL